MVPGSSGKKVAQLHSWKKVSLPYLPLLPLVIVAALTAYPKAVSAIIIWRRGPQIPPAPNQVPRDSETEAELRATYLFRVPTFLVKPGG